MQYAQRRENNLQMRLVRWVLIAALSGAGGGVIGYTQAPNDRVNLENRLTQVEVKLQSLLDGQNRLSGLIEQQIQELRTRKR